MKQRVTLTTCGYRVSEIHIHRPDRLNAINLELMDGLDRALEQLETATAKHTADSPLAVILSTAGTRSFISGGDLRELSTLTSQGQAFSMASRMESLLCRLEALPAITIAAIDGDAYGGGCETAIACDLRVAEAEAKLGWTQIKFGLSPGWGGAERLSQLVGRRRALLWLATGKILTATEALEHRLIEILARTQSARDEALELAGTIARQSPLAIRTLKTLLSPRWDRNSRAAIRREREHFTQLWASQDHITAVEAFFQGHQAPWKGE